MPDKPKPPPETSFTEVFLHGSGPGGQKINKTSSAVQLKHLPTGMVVKVQATRSRTQNRKLARQMLADRLDDREMGEGSWRKVVGEVKKRKKASKGKKARRKYRKLGEGEFEGERGEGDVDVDEGMGLEERGEDRQTEAQDQGQK
ncbi:RF-1 domain-containing protein [Amylocarpus encephaloides]|uniref:RF-1 domain-containing protein n=1 Tax=Amylocarpus encephaloides TaxID=45428 RepID=A0A9P8C7B3_9HELO|nr:RF-1 domain-containing protein [Amylocarpus encephaloides]